MSNMTYNRLEMIRTALCHLETEYEGDKERTKQIMGMSYDRFEQELEAIHAWVNREQKKRAKT